jgi:hypothetical protein
VNRLDNWIFKVIYDLSDGDEAPAVVEFTYYVKDFVYLQKRVRTLSAEEIIEVKNGKAKG